jgi:uncharacterized coiled-coil protein SlyX
MRTVIVLTLLISTIFAFDIECEFKKINHFTQFGEQYTCDVKNIILTGSRSLETVTGTHLQGFSDAHVKQISFGFSTKNCGVLSFIPENIEKRFTNFIGIGFWSCPIGSLTGSELKTYPNLEYFFMAHSPVDKIPGNFFENNRKLKLIGFWDCKVTKVGSNLLAGLQNLQTAYFDKNNCINAQVKDNRAEVLKLISKVQQLCPYAEESPSSPEHSSCPSENAAQRICQLEEQNRDQRKIIESLEGDIKKLERESAALKEKNKSLEDRLTTLEAKMNY